MCKGHLKTETLHRIFNINSFLFICCYNFRCGKKNQVFLKWGYVAWIPRSASTAPNLIKVASNSMRERLVLLMSAWKISSFILQSVAL